MTDVTALSDDEVRTELTTWAGRLAAGEAVFVQLVGELDAREAWGGAGVTSAAHWLTWQCGLGSNAARERVRVARALRELPVTQAEFAAGRLSFSQVRALTRVATAADETDLVEMARHCTAAQLERLVTGMRRALVAEETRAAHEAFERRALHYHWDDDGMLVIRGRLPADQGALVVKALEAAYGELLAADRRDRPESATGAGTTEAAASSPSASSPSASSPSASSPTATSTTTTSPIATVGVTAVTSATAASTAAGNTTTATAAAGAQVPATARLADALALVAQRSLVEARDAADDSDAYRVIVRIDAETLGDDGAGETPSIDGGPAVPPETVRRLLCDASVRAVTELRDGTMLDLGRSARFPNRALRRAVKARDKRCVYPACTVTRRLHVHHLVPWFLGGRTDLHDLAQLCSHHHHLVHEGGFSIRRLADGTIEVRTPHGHVVPPAHRWPVDGTRALERQPVAADTLPSRWGGESLDLHHTVSLLLERRVFGALHEVSGEPGTRHDQSRVPSLRAIEDDPPGPGEDARGTLPR